MLSQTITQTAPFPNQSASDRRFYCTHPNVYKHPKWPAYRAIAQITHRSGKQATADVVVINPCLAAIDKCLDAVLGSGWHTISFEWADTSF